MLMASNSFEESRIWRVLIVAIFKFFVSKKYFSWYESS